MYYKLMIFDLHSLSVKCLGYHKFSSSVGAACNSDYGPDNQFHYGDLQHIVARDVRILL